MKSPHRPILAFQLCTSLSLAGALLGSAGVAQAADRGAPPTAIKQVTDHYGDLEVKDSYRWLEKQGDPKVHQWSLAQDKRTRHYFDKLPFRKPIYERLMAQIGATSSSYYNLHGSGDKVFAMYNQPPKQQPMIAVLDQSADPSKARVVVDPNLINVKGTTAIDWFVPSPKGDLVAVSDVGQWQ